MGSTTTVNNSKSPMEQSEEEAFLFAMRLATGSVLPMVLKSVIELNLLELIKKADTSASASALAAQLPINNPNAVVMIDRLLRILSAHSILICSHKPMSGSSGVERHYSLEPVCKFLTENEDGVSIAPLLLMNQDKVFMESWYHLKEAVLDGGIPFDRAHKVSVYEFPAADPRVNKLFNSSMYEPSTIILRKIVEIYKGFEGVKSLVDVGGGTGAALNMIISKYPSIRGINFDLPHVAKAAPPSSGVEHVGGDMFTSVPKADAIFLKWVCHNWSDDYVQKVFNNCYEALPEYGKLIVAEYVLPEDPNSGEMDYSEVVDLAMMAYTQGGKERTQREFEALAKGAGFKKLHKVCSAFGVWVMELYK